jgi:hypothetical protein
VLDGCQVAHEPIAAHNGRRLVYFGAYGGAGLRSGRVSAPISLSQLDALPHGRAKPFPRHRSLSSPGGKGGNQAVAAARAGAAVQSSSRRSRHRFGGRSVARTFAGTTTSSAGRRGQHAPGSSGSAVIIVDSAAEANTHRRGAWSQRKRSPERDLRRRPRSDPPTATWCCCSWKIPDLQRPSPPQGGGRGRRAPW